MSRPRGSSHSTSSDGSNSSLMNASTLPGPHKHATITSSISLAEIYHHSPKLTRTYNILYHSCEGSTPETAPVGVYCFRKLHSTVRERYYKAPPQKRRLYAMVLPRRQWLNEVFLLKTFISCEESKNTGCTDSSFGFHCHHKNKLRIITTTTFRNSLDSL